MDEGRGDGDRLSCDRSQLHFIGGLSRENQGKRDLERETIDVTLIGRFVFNHGVLTSWFNGCTE